MTHSPTRCALLLAALGSLALPVPSAAQFFPRADTTARRLLATRAELTALAQALDSLAVAPRAGIGDRNRAGPLAAQVRARLAAGDFQAGDRVVVRVTGEVGLADTFAVTVGPELILPTVGEIPLRGVLRSEIEPQVARAVAQVIRDAEVRARPLMRVSVQGEVARPGYFSVPPDAPLSDVLTAAGGPTKDAKVADLRIERGNVRVLEKERLRQLIAQGRTLDAADVRPGDEFVVPRRGGGHAGEAVRLAAVILSIPVTIYTLTKIIH
jgi:protein involved in polysaccharide export with SLBB domain